MPDPLLYRQTDSAAANQAGPLFDFPAPKKDTIRLAGEVAAAISGKRRRQILQLLTDRGPMTLWQLAEAMAVHDNQISGRMTDLKRDGLIEATGERLARPGSPVKADVYRVVLPKLPILPISAHT